MKSHRIQRFSAIAVVTGFAVVMLSARYAFAKVGVQMSSFYYNNGDEVMSDSGEPDDAVLNRLYSTQRDGINWQLMTQHLTPGTSYDVWMVGSNDGTEGGAFIWWVGSGKATPQGDLNLIGVIYTGNPPGPAAGSFSNSRAALHLVIKAADGTTAQTAVFPAF